MREGEIEREEGKGRQRKGREVIHSCACCTSTSRLATNRHSSCEISLKRLNRKPGPQNNPQEEGKKYQTAPYHLLFPTGKSFSPGHLACQLYLNLLSPEVVIWAEFPSLPDGIKWFTNTLTSQWNWQRAISQDSRGCERQRIWGVHDLSLTYLFSSDTYS